MFMDGSSGGNFGGWKGKTPKSPREITLKKNKIQTFPKGGWRERARRVED